MEDRKNITAYRQLVKELKSLRKGSGVTQLSFGSTTLLTKIMEVNTTPSRQAVRNMVERFIEDEKARAFLLAAFNLSEPRSSLDATGRRSETTTAWNVSVRTVVRREDSAINHIAKQLIKQNAEIVKDFVDNSAPGDKDENAMSAIELFTEIEIIRKARKELERRYTTEQSELTALEDRYMSRLKGLFMPRTP